MVRVLVTGGAESKLYVYLEKYYGLKGIGEWVEEEMKEGHKAEDIVTLLQHNYTPYFLFEFLNERSDFPQGSPGYPGEYFVHEKSAKEALESAQMQIRGEIHVYAGVKPGDYLITESAMDYWLGEEIGEKMRGEKVNYYGY